MANGPSKNRSLKKRDVQDLNLVPIMNLFVVVLPLLITMYATVKLNMMLIDISGGSAANSAEGSGGSGAVKAKMITVGLFPEHFEVKVEGRKDIIKINALDTQSSLVVYDYKKLDTVLHDLKAEFPEQQTIEIIPDPEIAYDVLMRSIDVCKYNQFRNIKYSIAQTRAYMVQ